MSKNNCKCTECQCQEKERQAFLDTFESAKPYDDWQEDGQTIRTFPKETEAHLLKWHEDEEDRIVIAANNTDWQFQFDNELPQQIPTESGIHIPKGKIHRLIKGNDDLTLYIRKL